MFESRFFILASWRAEHSKLGGKLARKNEAGSLTAMKAVQETKRPRTNPGPEWIHLGRFLLLRYALPLGGFDEGRSSFGLAGFLGFGLG